MNPRLALYDWIGRYGLDRTQSRALFQLAGFLQEPIEVDEQFWRAVAVLAAALGGFGVILWIAANWTELGRMGRFALLQGTIVAFCIGAAWRRAWRAPLALGALLAIGGLFAYFGQTYQTGADPWQLFALWALLALPLCLGARSDVLWAPWALVAAAAISLWTHAHLGHRWRVEPQELPVFALAWSACALLVLFLSGLPARFTGAGPWALRTAATFTVLMVTLTGLGALFQDTLPRHYLLAVSMFAAAAALLSLRRTFEIYLLSAVALGLDTLLVGGLARALFHRHDSGEPIGRLLLIGLVAAALLALSVSWILRLARRYAERPDA